MRRLLLVLALALAAVGGAVAQAHSYPDPALRTVFDGVQPTALPAGVTAVVRPSVVDELVVSNSTGTPLEVLAVGGEAFLRVSSAGVEANLASPDWYSTGTPEGGPPPPADVLRDRGKGTPRWARVSTGTLWSEFDSRLRPNVTATPELRAAGKDRILAAWSIPLRYGDLRTTVTGHVLFSPVRGGLTVAVTKAPVEVTALQGELPGLFLRAPTKAKVEVAGRDGEPFLRFEGGVVLANSASRSWVEDQRAKGREVTGRGWVRAGRGQTYSWLDGRLRYPADQPPDDVIGTRTVVQRWQVPVTVGGTAGQVEGTVTWVPRAQALAQVRGTAKEHRIGGWWWAAALAGLAAAGAGARVLVRRRR